MDPHAKRAVIMHIASSGLLHYPALFSDGIGLVARSGPPPEPRRAHTPLLKTRNRLLGNLDVWCPRDLIVTYSQHYCTKCRQYFSADLSDLAPPGSQYTHRVMDLAIRLVVEDGMPYRPASWHLWRDHRVFVPFATIQNWVEAGGKKGAGTPGPGLP